MNSFNHREQHRDEQMIMIQANIDDMNPEYCSYIADLLFEEGANDVYWHPITMKKGRPGIMLNVLCDRAQLKKIESIIFMESTTIGLRYMDVTCHRLGRKWVKVQTQWGEVDVKVGIYNGEEVQYAPEYSQCVELAREMNVPLKKIYDEVRLQYEILQQRTSS